MFIPRQVKLDENGCGKILGEVESCVMENLWLRGEGATVREVCQSLSGGRGGGRKLSFNTIMTIMNRLVEKGLLKKKVVTGQYQYWPSLGRCRFFEKVTNKITAALVRDPSVFSLAAFVQTLGEDPRRLEELKKLLDGQGAFDSK